MSHVLPPSSCGLTCLRRPIRYTGGEIDGFALRARYMASIAPEALADTVIPSTSEADAAVKRYIRREPLGPVLVLSAWNYPYLVSVNGVVPALIAGMCTSGWLTSSAG